MKLWVGYEKEGELKGIKTLFVGSSAIKEEQIIKVMANDYEIEQIYFGAGCCTRINMVTLKNIYNKYFDSVYITAEIDINKLDRYDINFLKKIRLILTVNNKNFSYLKKLELSDLHIKIQSIYDSPKTLAIAYYGTFKKTNLNKLKGKCYNDDEVLE